MRYYALINFFTFLIIAHPRQVVSSRLATRSSSSSDVIRGVNLGGWLITEQWWSETLTNSFMTDTEPGSHPRSTHRMRMTSGPSATAWARNNVSQSYRFTGRESRLHSQDVTSKLRASQLLLYSRRFREYPSCRPECPSDTNRVLGCRPARLRTIRIRSSESLSRLSNPRDPADRC